MGNKMRVVIALSGGVDSAVAAAILKEEGYQVIGATMQIWPPDKVIPEVDHFSGYCGVGTIEEAKRVAHKLSIPHHVMNFKDIFAQKVIADFYKEYSQGRTPNPCIRCNQYIKFGVLLNRAKELGTDFVATGHHARIVKDEAKGRYLLKKGIDRRKDQSYVLYSLTQEQLSRILLPIGNLTKEKVREIARELGLPAATKLESQDICFIPDNNYSNFLKEYVPQAVKPGPILNKEGSILGQHRGIASYTIGQRRGLGISAKEPMYVTAIDQEGNAIMVGSKQEVYSKELIASRLNWITLAELRGTIRAKAKIRYRHKEAEAEVTPLDDSNVHVKFKEPQMAITPGQAVVFYQGDTVIGGGIIEKASFTLGRDSLF